MLSKNFKGTRNLLNSQTIFFFPIVVLAFVWSTTSFADSYAWAQCPADAVPHCQVTFSVREGTYQQSFAYLDNEGGGTLPRYTGTCHEFRCEFSWNGGGPGSVPAGWNVWGRDVIIHDVRRGP